MAPSVALLLCAGFVLFLLRLEHRMSYGVSPTLWIPTLWMLISASRPLGVWFGVTGNNESGSPLDRWVLTGLAVAGLVVLASRRFELSRILRQQKWLVVLLVYMLLSTLWSDISLIAVRRWMRECVVIVIILLILSEADPRQALASVLRRTAYILIPFSLVLIKYYPALGRAYGRWSGIEMWTGVTGHKNLLGRLCMISIFFLLWALYQRWRKRSSLEEVESYAFADVTVLALATYLLIGSNSATSLATLLVGIAAFLGLSWFRKSQLTVPRAGLLALVVILVSYGVSIPYLGGSDVASFTSFLGRDNTLTGRTEVWAAVLPAIDRRPLLGYGFGSFWTDARRDQYDIPTAHNGYLDVMLELGQVGLVLFTVWLLSCARQLHFALAEDYEWASLAICFLLMSLVYNGTESALNSLTEQMTAVVLMATLVASVALRQEVSPDQTCSLEGEHGISAARSYSVDAYQW
jgi:O-antigen ligase